MSMFDGGGIRKENLCAPMLVFWAGPILSFLLLGIGCVAPSGDKDSGTVFRYNQSTTITSLDPAFALSMSNIWATHHLFSKLVRLNSKLEVIGDVARSWTVDSSALEYTFVLKDSIFFHESDLWAGGVRRLTAKDVVYSFSRIIDDKVASPGSWIFRNRVDVHRPFYAPNDSTFVLKLKSPFAPMLSILTMEYCGIVPSEMVEYHGINFRSHPVGTGPYRLLKWKESQGLFLKKNEDYGRWNPGLPKESGIRVYFLRDRKTALLEMLSGNIDLISGYDVQYNSLLLDVNGEVLARHRDQVTLTKSPFLNTEYLGINLKLADSLGSPLVNVHFRKALSFGLDRNLLVQSVNGSIGCPGNQGFIPRGLPSFDSLMTGYVYNQDSAQFHLVLSGYQGQEIVLETNKDYLEKCLFASRMWQSMGVNVRVELLESSMLRDKVRKGRSVFFRSSWIADYPDGENFLSVFYGDNAAPPNYTRFKNEEFDTWYRRGLQAIDLDEKVNFYRRADSVLMQHAPVIILYYDESFILTRPQLRNFKSNALNLLETEALIICDRNDPPPPLQGH